MATTIPFEKSAHLNSNPPSLVSESAIVIDAKTGEIIYEKNIDSNMYPASITKIATAIYAIENGNLDEVVTISENARNTGGSSVYLEEGEQVPLKKLIQGLLINSGNDAGVAIAEHLSGNIEQFSSDINQYLEEKVGTKHTNFENPHGLYDPNHLTTAEDLATITQYAMENEVFREINATIELDWEGETWDTTLINHHKLMREIPYEGITGGKTGFTGQSGFTLATTAERENLSVIVITLKSYSQEASYTDTMNLLDYAFENFQTTSISKGTTFSTGDVDYEVTKDIFYTHKTDVEVEEKINEEGILNVLNKNDDTLIATFQLDQVDSEANDRSLANKETEHVELAEKKMTLFESYIIEITFVSIFILVLMGIINRKRWKLF
ncbi:D-alanyl-D-alanine carboxypeptidase [Ornithinibacillus sp. L9]|uniref:D-alanyl-D-alanine carboxypeptidase n=2 Tax=Ornithinibacillus caprae TaxID=2678566 RepID=A0A6N8FII0_9BACI|nr:D-alanyl-D-alanine carboxypeptidase family protein [Ornithinibacillus caprae]MUK89265.1 D-alanyl-D-alanine carboxypeptidase [Ornithinibacillus caprae]